MHLILSYCKSHIYELHAILAATLTFLLMFPLKKPIKDWTRKYVSKRAHRSEKWKKNEDLYRKRMNLLVIFTTIILSMALFGIVSYLSPLIHFSWYTAILSASFSMAEYAVYDQIRIKGRDKA